MHKQPCVPSSASTYETGLACLGSVEGSTTPAIVCALADIAPDLATLVVSVVYGEIYQRKHLSLPQRQLATVAALAAPGQRAPSTEVPHCGRIECRLPPCRGHRVDDASGRPCRLSMRLERSVQSQGSTGRTGGRFPAAINLVSTAHEVFFTRERSDGRT